MGCLLAQQLVAAGELVLDVQPKLGARVRLLATGKTNKNDPDDALSVAIAALRSAATAQVRPDAHATVLKVWSKRHRDLSRSRNQVVCRLHAVLCGSSDKPLPDLPPPYDPGPAAPRPRAVRRRGRPLACPLFLPPGTVEAPVSTGGRRPSRASAMYSTLKTRGKAP